LRHSAIVLKCRRVTCLRVRLGCDLDKPAYFLLVSTLLLDIARSHPLQPVAIVAVLLQLLSSRSFTRHDRRRGCPPVMIIAAVLSQHHRHPTHSHVAVVAVASSWSSPWSSSRCHLVLIVILFRHPVRPCSLLRYRSRHGQVRVGGVNIVGVGKACGGWRGSR
jgi:hypothetical protein